MTSLLLFGGIGENFLALSCERLFNHQRLSGPLALIVQNEEIANYCRGITEPWYNYADVRIVSLSAGTESPVDAVKTASAIVVGPGKTMVYREAMLGSPLADLIAEKVESGVPYAGISAGAMLAGERLARDTDAGVAVFPALGLVRGVCLEPHYDAGREGSLRYQMMHTGLCHGLGIGNAMCVDIANGSRISVFGDGECVLWQNSPEGAYMKKIYKQGDCLSI